MIEEYEQRKLFEFDENNLEYKAITKPKAKKDSYFDGYHYRGYAVKTLLIRENVNEYNPIKIDSDLKVYKMFEKLVYLDHERFYSVVIDGNTQVIAVHMVSKGTLNQTLIHPREIFKTAAILSAAGVILVHNHPSGSAEPSKEDYVVTQQFVEAGRIMGINLIDHIVIGHGKHFSFQRRGILRKM
jgi:DNA repair protein RadC